MIQRKVNEVFIDSENFKEPKMLKCVENPNSVCPNCVYKYIGGCNHIACLGIERLDHTTVMFIETNEPVSHDKD